MALHKQVTALTDLGATPASGDYFYVVDVSDTSGGASGTSKKVTYSRIPSGSAGQPTSVSTFTPGFSFTNPNQNQTSFNTVGERHWGEVMIPFNVTFTGIGYRVGNTVGTDKIIVELHDVNGLLLARSSAAGTLTAGSNGDYQKVAFTSPYAASAGRYFVVVQCNGLTDTIIIDDRPALSYVCNYTTGTFGVAASITPGTTFNVGTSPVFYLY